MTTSSLAENDYTCPVVTHKTKEHPVRHPCTENEGWKHGDMVHWAFLNYWAVEVMTHHRDHGKERRVYCAPASPPQVSMIGTLMPREATGPFCLASPNSAEQHMCLSQGKVDASFRNSTIPFP